MNANLNDHEGNLWFGTIKGFTKCDISYDKVNENEPILRISSADVKKIGTVVPSSVKDNLFPYYANEIKFNWMGISHTQPEAVRYRFKLDGKDDDWRSITNKTDFTYTNLDPGHYSFMIKSSNNDGEWNESPVVYRFSIETPWYKTIYAYLSYILLGGLILYVFIKIRMMQIQKEKESIRRKSCGKN